MPARPASKMAVLAVVLAVAACGSQPSEEVLDFGAIAVADPQIEFDPKGTTAFLTVETSIDAVCAVSYGIGEPVGKIATDREMDPDGHREHRVTLSGLQPDTTYEYRLQGVGADGQLYRSEIFTFRTPEAEESALGPNLAIGATVVGVSSEFSSSFAAAHALDGDFGTEWSTRGDGDDAFIEVDLGHEVEVSHVVFHTREMSDGSSITSLFSVTVDGGDVLGPYPAGPNPVAVDLLGRVFRFDVVESTGGNTGAVEIEMYKAESS